MEAKVITLKNGLRVIYKYVPYTRTVHCGYVINSGSRDDREGEMGMAHFVEHMIFKGTVRRKTFHILNYLESVGGDVNAYTTKEKTCLYASMVSDYFERATELLTDIAFFSVFPEREIAKEMQVIGEEIDMYRNAPDEAIFEDFDEMIFPRHGLGYPILGTKDTIRGFTQADIQGHIRRSFVQDHMVFSIVGNVSEKEVHRVLEKYLAPVELPTGGLARQQPAAVQLYDHREVEIPTDQVHEITGGRAYAMNQDNYVPFLLLNNLLGGPAMNSRLNLNIREKYGLTYSIYSFYSPFLDTGIWGIYYACERNNLDRIRRLVDRELRQMWEKPLGIVRLSQAKKQLIGQMTLGAESLLNQMLGMAKDLLDFGRIFPLEELVADIEKVQAIDIQDTARELFHEAPRAQITYLAS
ncbi:MAG: insulinase family protein [Bacteroidetes bacterium]|nr:MAG: insulinase family protein [Bacteroidota bacterium]